MFNTGELYEKFIKPIDLTRHLDIKNIFHLGIDLTCSIYKGGDENVKYW